MRIRVQAERLTGIRGICTLFTLAPASELSAAEVAALTKFALVAEISDVIAVVLEELLSEIDIG